MEKEDLLVICTYKTRKITSKKEKKNWRKKKRNLLTPTQCVLEINWAWAVIVTLVKDKRCHIGQ